MSCLNYCYKYFVTFYLLFQNYHIFVTVPEIIINNQITLIMPETGLIMKSLREKFGYVQENVAEYLGISRELVSMYETGEREIPIEVLEKLSNLFCVDPDALFAETPEEAIAQVAFAFRKDEMAASDLTEIAAFGKIVKNYLKVKKLNGQL